MAKSNSITRHFNTTHGMTGTREFTAWQEAKRRCYLVSGKDYHRYGARGIRVCSRWKDSFENFFEDMGSRPEGASLDRRDNDRDYSPDNCRWATLEQQANNMRSTHFLLFKGKRLSMAQWGREIGICVETLKYRVYAGWSIERALTTPVGSRRKPRV